MSNLKKWSISIYLRLSLSWYHASDAKDCCRLKENMRMIVFLSAKKKRSDTKCFIYLGKCLLSMKFNPCHINEKPCFLYWSLRKRFGLKVFSWIYYLETLITFLFYQVICFNQRIAWNFTFCFLFYFDFLFSSFSHKAISYNFAKD